MTHEYEPWMLIASSDHWAWVVLPDGESLGWKTIEMPLVAAKAIVSDHNKSLSPSTEQELLEAFPFTLKYVGETPVLVHKGDYDGVTNTELRDGVMAFLSKLTPKTEEVEKP